jgi:16S rRNA (guanine527-N7)-methyltransferase
MEKTETGLELIKTYFPGLSDLQLQQFGALNEQYKDWNQRINVISRKDIDSIYEKHVLHSLAVAKFFQFADSTELLDLGTGGGFPGIPLAILFPNCSFLLIDSIGKKIKVVEAISSALGLKNIEALPIRVEELRKRKFDFVLTRAVASLEIIWKWTIPLMRVNPKARSTHSQGLISLKGGDLSKEIAACGCNAQIMEIHAFFPLEYFRQKYVLFVQQPV